MPPHALERLTSQPVILASAILLVTMGLAQAPAFAQMPDLPEEVTVDPPFLGVPAYAEDFQDDEGAWEAQTPPAPPMTWEHGPPSSGPGEAVIGENVWATNLDGHHRPYECGALLSPPIDLTTATTAEVSFEHWYHIHQGTWSGDGGVVLVSTDDGASFDQVSPLEGYDAQLPYGVRNCLDLDTHATGFTGTSGGYRTATVDLDPYLGTEVRLALGFASGDSAQVRDGWYMDAFTVTIDGQAEIEAFQDDGGFSYEAFDQPEQPIGWEWGVPSTAAGPSFDEPTRLWGTHLDGDHGKNECSTLESPPIDLTGPIAQAPHAELAWDQWFQSSTVSGGGVVQVGHDGTYTNLVPRHGYPGAPYQALDGCLEHQRQGTGAFAGMLQRSGDDMVPQRADLTPWLGQEVTIRFVFATTDGMFQVDGWYINDVRVQAGAGVDPVTVGLPGPSDAATSTFQPLSTVYDEDFEADAGDWETLGTQPWTWGTPVLPPEVAPGSLNLWGTDLLGTTAAGSCGYLESPPIQLPDLDAPQLDTLQLTLDTYRDLAPRADGAVVMVEGQDGHRYVVEPEAGYDGTLWWLPQIACLGIWFDQPVWTSEAAGPEAWHSDAFDLSRFAGEEIRLHLAYASGETETHAGIYLDRATIQLGAGADLAPPDPTDPQATLEATCQEEVPGWDVQRERATWCNGLPTTGPQTLEPVWATDPHGQHRLAECSRLVTDPIDTSNVPGLGTLTLTLEHYMETRYRAGGQVQISKDGGQSWSTLTPVGGYPSSTTNGLTVSCLDPGADRTSFYRGAWMSGYEPIEFNLRAYQGETIQIGFAFAGMDFPDLGWYIRDVELDRGLAPVPVEALSNLPDPDPVQPPATSPLEALLAEADPGLLEAILEDPDGHHEVVVTGPAHDPVPAGIAQDRAQAMAYLTQAADPFLRTVQEAVQAHGGKVVDTWPSAPAAKIHAPLTTLETVAASEHTRHLASDGYGTVQLVDPITSEEDGPGILNTEGRKLVQAEEAWELGYTGEGITISVIDTGIDGRHEAFKHADGTSRITGWLDIYGGQEDPYDDHGHGTHVAATAAGSSVYEDPVHGTFQETGVAPEAQILGVKFLSGAGGGQLSDALEALEWSYENGADITSNSWGSSCSASASIISMVDQLTELGMVSVFAAGNSGPGAGSVGGPACGETSVTVGAVDDEAEIASFSSRGPCTDPTLEDAQERICPDVVAKGESVRSAIPRDGAAASDPSGYQTWDGTSMATPHVAGALALVEQMKIDLTGTGWDTASGADKQILEATALPLPTFDADPNNAYGQGLVQVMSVYHVLTSEGEVNVVDTFAVQDQDLRIGERTSYHVMVRNHGTLPAVGTFQATLTHPDGTVDTLKDTEVALDLLDIEGLEGRFEVGSQVKAGTYTLQASFAYTWEDPTTGTQHQDLIEHEADLVVTRPYLDLALPDLAEQAPPLLPQPTTYVARNIGNEEARDVELRLSVPDTYQFLVPEDGDPTDPAARYASPPPSEVHEDGDQVTLVFEVGALAVGASAEIELRLVPTLPGDQRFLPVGLATDQAGNRVAQGELVHQHVQGVEDLVPVQAPAPAGLLPAG